MPSRIRFRKSLIADWRKLLRDGLMLSNCGCRSGELRLERLERSLWQLRMLLRLRCDLDASRIIRNKLFPDNRRRL
jgi:hypothetical protein